MYRHEGHIRRVSPTLMEELGTKCRRKCRRSRQWCRKTTAEGFVVTSSSGDDVLIVFPTFVADADETAHQMAIVAAFVVGVGYKFNHAFFAPKAQFVGTMGSIDTILLCDKICNLRLLLRLKFAKAAFSVYSY